MKFVILLLLLLPFVNSSRPDSANDYMKCEYCLKIVPICRASGDFKSAEHAYYEKIRPTYMIYKHAIVSFNIIFGVYTRMSRNFEKLFENFLN